MPRFRRANTSFSFACAVFIAGAFFTVILNNPIVVNAANPPSRGIAGDRAADIVLGKDNFGEGTPGQVVPYKVMNPGGVWIDKSSSPNRVYIYDGANSRVLGYSSLGSCTIDTGTSCTNNSDCIGEGDSCNITPGGKNGKLPDIVIGQPDFYHSGCNGDSNFQQFPDRKTASANTLCSMPEYQVSPSEGGSFASLSTDTEGNLYVADFDNNRVLKYNNPFAQNGMIEASQVWGQSDFSGNSCNRTPGDINQAKLNPQNNTLCFRSQTNDGFGAGTDIDKDGNLWITDNQNNRVLRFSKIDGIISENADLVLGEPDMTTYTPGSSAIDRMFSPVAVRTDQISGRVYVADSKNNRVLYFDGPFENGMGATGTFASSFNNPTGIEFDKNHNGIWINDSGNNQLVLFNLSGEVQKVLYKDTYQANGQCGSINEGAYTDKPLSNMCGSYGSVGIDSDGNIYPAGSSQVQDVWRFDAPIALPTEGVAISASHSFFSPPDNSGGQLNNSVGDTGFFSPRGIVKTSDQLIIVDAKRILFWNTSNGLSNITDGKSADGVAGVADFNTQDPWNFFSATEYNNQLWVTHRGEIQVYNLPLTMGETPVSTPISYYSGINVLGADPISNGGGFGSGEDFSDVEFDANGKLWVTQPERNRVLRIRNPLTNPEIDVILGQTNSTTVGCNQNDPDYNGNGYDPNVPLNYLCTPGFIKYDKNGNLFISDNWIELNGNARVLIFNQGSIPDNPDTALYSLTATSFIPDIRSFKPAFNANNQMTVGFNGYSSNDYPALTTTNAQSFRFPKIYVNPLDEANSPSTSSLSDFYSMPLFSTLDSDNVLYISDLNRGRVLIYKSPNLGAGVDAGGCTATCHLTPVVHGTCPQFSSCVSSGSSSPTVDYSVSYENCPDGVAVDAGLEPFNGDYLKTPNGTWEPAVVFSHGTSALSTSSWNFCNGDGNICWSFDAGQTLYWRVRDLTNNNEIATCNTTYSVALDQVVPSPTPNLNPTPTIVVTPTLAPVTGVTSSSSQTTNTPPECSDTKPVSAPDLFQVNTSGTTAKLFFTPISNTEKFYISFSSKPIAEEHGADISLSREGVQNFIVNSLNSNSAYYFKVRGQNGCMPGDWSNIVKIITQAKGSSQIVSFYKNSSPTTSLFQIKKTVNQSTIYPSPTTFIPKINPHDTQPLVTPIVNKKKCFLWICY